MHTFAASNYVLSSINQHLDAGLSLSVAYRMRKESCAQLLKAYLTVVD